MKSNHMSHLLLTGCFFLSVLTHAQVQVSQESDDEQAIMATIKGMAKAFAKKDIAGYTEYWTYPGSYLLANEAPVVFSNKSVWGAFIQQFRESLPENYKESRPDKVSIKIVGNGMAMASILWGRYSTSDEHIGAFGDVYTLVKREGTDRWLVSTAIGNDPDRFVVIEVAEQ